VVVAGRPTLSRPVTRLLARTDLEVLRLRDDPRTPEVIGTPDVEWLHSWQDADRAARGAVAGVLAAEPATGLSVARLLAASVPPDGLLPLLAQKPPPALRALPAQCCVEKRRHPMHGGRGPGNAPFELAPERRLVRRGGEFAREPLRRGTQRGCDLRERRMSG
jgi:hypothetical protein